MNFTQSGEEPVSLDPRWLVEGGDFGVDERGFWARPFADDVSLLRIDFFDPWQGAVWSDGLCRLLSRDGKGARRLQRVSPSMKLFGPGGTLAKECLAIPETLSFTVPLAASVPKPLRCLVGRFEKARDQWRVLEIFQDHLELGEKLPEQEAYVSEVLRLWFRHSFGVSEVDIAKKIMRGKRQCVLQSFQRVPVKPKHVRMLARFDPALSSKGKDLFWHSAKSDDRFRAFQNVEVFTDQIARDLGRVPVWIEEANPKIFKYADAEAIEHMAALQQYQSFGSVPKDAVQQVRSVRSRQDIMALGFDLKFPPCPVAGDAFLEPIRNIKALGRAGLELRNCAADFAHEVIEGRSYFLLWKGRRKGFVQIGKGKDGAWEFVQALGVGNTRLHRSTIKAIKRRLGEMDLQ